jgi:hypothetical protein
VSRHAAARRPRSAWLTAWQLAQRARNVGAWLRVEAPAVWTQAAAARWCRARRRRRLLLVVAYYVVAVLAVDTLAMLISGGK